MTTGKQISEARNTLSYAKEKHESQLRMPISLQIAYINHPR